MDERIGWIRDFLAILEGGILNLLMILVCFYGKLTTLFRISYVYTYDRARKAAGRQFAGTPEW